MYAGILRYTIPIIFTNILQILFNTADLIIIGQYCGGIYVAAVSATTSLTSWIVTFLVELILFMLLLKKKATAEKNTAPKE